MICSSVNRLHRMVASPGQKAPIRLGDSHSSWTSFWRFPGAGQPARARGQCQDGDTGVHVVVAGGDVLALTRATRTTTSSAPRFAIAEVHVLFVQGAPLEGGGRDPPPEADNAKGATLARVALAFAREGATGPVVRAILPQGPHAPPRAARRL